MSTTIDLGKLRFNWVGVWVSNTLYEYNDLVRHGGDVFVYIYSVKTSGNLTTNTTYWAKVQEGLSWQGEYDSTNAYNFCANSITSWGETSLTSNGSLRDGDSELLYPTLSCVRCKLFSKIVCA